MTKIKSKIIKGKAGKSLLFEASKTGVYIEIASATVTGLTLTPNGAYNLYKLLEQYVKVGPQP